MCNWPASCCGLAANVKLVQEGWRYCCTEEWARKTKCQPDKLYVSPNEGALAAAQSALQASSVHEAGTAGTALLRATAADNGTAAGHSAAMTAGHSNATVDAGDAFPGFPWRADADFMNNDLSTHTIFEDPIVIKETGLYSVWFITCDPKLTEVRRFNTTPTLSTYVPSRRVSDGLASNAKLAKHMQACVREQSMSCHSALVPYSPLSAGLCERQHSVEESQRVRGNV
jgi:hypothetical protein